MGSRTYLLVIVGLFLICSPIFIKSHDEIKPNEITLRNQLFSDVYLLKEGVDRLVINTEILNKRFTNQVEILKTVQTKLLTDDNDEEDDGVCERFTGMFNATYRKFNAFENRLVIKLEEMQDEQTTRLDEILAKQKLNKNCGSKGLSSSSLDEFTSLLTEVNEKIEIFKQKLTRLEKLEEKFNEQQNILNKFLDSQTTILQQINDKLNKNQELLEKYEKELPKLIELNSKLATTQRRTHPKLPMEVILGLTSANVTALK